jgi:hypothetical protein
MDAGPAFTDPRFTARTGLRGHRAGAGVAPASCSRRASSRICRRSGPEILEKSDFSRPNRRLGTPLERPMSASNFRGRFDRSVGVTSR